MTRGFAVRLGAVVATLLALLVGADYVAAHAKNPSAPLQPAVANKLVPPSATPGGRIQIAPGVKATELPGITFTHVS